MAVKIRLANQGDFKTCNALHNAAYDSARSLEQWAWTFISSLFSEADLHFVLAEDEGKIVGTQALIPIQMIDADGVYWSAKSEETLVDLEYRGRGFLKRCTRKPLKWQGSQILSQFGGSLPRGNLSSVWDLKYPKIHLSYFDRLGQTALLLFFALQLVIADLAV